MGIKFTQKEFEDKLHSKYPNIKITGKYDGYKNKIKYICPCCNHEHDSLPQSLMQGHFCRKNIGKNNPNKKDTKSFIKEIELIDPNIKVIGQYINANEPISFICSCGTRHKSSPSLLLMGHRCGHCNMSKSEYSTKYYLEGHNVEYIFNYKFDDCVNKIPLKFDFYIPKYNMCIELDGEHHFKPVAFKGISYELALERHQYTKKLDEIKNIYCEKNMINLIRIPYWDFSNIENILDKFFYLKEDKKKKGSK